MTAVAGVPDGPVPGYLGRVMDAGTPVGTCFQVAPGVLVTAWHVLDDTDAAADDARVRVDPLAGGQAFEAAVARQDQAHDLAVLVSAVRLPAVAGELAATDQMAPQAAVTVTGHGVIAGSGRIARSLTTTGRWAGPAIWEDAVPTGRMTAEALLPGMSGAPVIRDSDGAVAGVVSGRYNSADDWLKGTVWVVRTEDLAVLLDGIAEVTMRQASRGSLAAGRSEALAAQRARVRSYLDAARAAVGQLPYTINIPGVSAPVLGTVYLRQQLGAQIDQALSSDVGGSVPRQEPSGGAGREPGGDPGKEPTTSPGQEPPAPRRGAYVNPNTGATADRIKDALQRFDIEDVLARNHEALILGGPGSGKSSLMRHVIEVAADSWHGEDRDTFVPVLVHARSLLSPWPMNKAIANTLRQDLGARLDDIDLDGLLANPPMPGLAWLILLDGLDEIPEVRRRDIMDIVDRWREEQRYRFVIASRPLPDLELHTLRRMGIPIFEIQEFSDDQLPILAARWFHALRVSDVEQAVGLFIARVRQARMAQLARNPLIATLSCVVFARHQDRGLPYSRADLYEVFIRSSLDNIHEGHFLGSIKERVEDYGQQAVVAVETLASKLRSLMQDLAISRLTGSALDLRTEAAQLARPYWPSDEPPKPWDDVVAELLVHSGLISMRTDDLAFTHETIAEYLAACARTTPPRSGRVGIRERWRLVTHAGSNESYPLFVVALLRGRDIVDLTRRPPALLHVRKLLHARLVAALVHDGCEPEPHIVAVATERLTAIAARKTSGIPFILRRGIWWQDEDCVIAAKGVTLIDKDRGLELLFTLAADPTVPSFSIFDVLAEVMAREDLTEIDSARGLSILYRYASAPSSTGVDRQEDSYNRMLIADLILDRNAELGTELLRTLARDSSMDLPDRMDCIKRLMDTDKQTAIEALTSIIIDTSNGLPVVLTTYDYLGGLEPPAAVAALAHVATDPTRGGYSRAVASTVLYHTVRAEGLRAIRELSGDRDVPGFYRVYYFAQFGDYEERDGRLLQLSRDTTLPADWRSFAAEELSAHDRETGIDALRAIQQDLSVGRQARAKLGIRAFLLERFPAPPGLLTRAWIPVARLMRAENLVSGADRTLQSMRMYALPQERLLGMRRPHPAPLLAPLSFALCGLAAAILLSALFPSARDLAAIWAVWGLTLLYLAWRVGAWSVEYLVLTNMRLIRARGLVTRKINMMPLGKIADMQFERPLFGLVFDYGTISIAAHNSTTGMQLKYMSHPGRLYQDLLSLFLAGDM